MKPRDSLLGANVSVAFGLSVVQHSRSFFLKNKGGGGRGDARTVKSSKHQRRGCTNVKKSKRGACEQKAATALPNRTAAT